MEASKGELGPSALRVKAIFHSPMFLLFQPSELFFFFLISIYLFIYFWLCLLGLCARALRSCCERGPLFIAVRGPLTIVASLVAEHKLQTRRPSNCGSRAQPLRGMRDPPRPGLEPMFPAPAGGLSTTAPPGKPQPSELLPTKVFL